MHKEKSKTMERFVKMTMAENFPKYVKNTNI